MEVLEKLCSKKIRSVKAWSRINTVRRQFAAEFKTLFFCCFVVLACPCASGHLAFCHQLRIDLQC